MYNNLNLDKFKGLSHDEAREAKINGLNNRCNHDSQSVFSIVAEHLFSYFNFIFAFLAVLLIFVSSYKSLTFLPVVIANTGIGIVHKLRAKKLIDKLQLLSTGTVKVLREGEVVEISSFDLVKGDIAVLELGNQIYADAVILEGSIYVNESLVTGESDEIEKKENDELLSGSYITAGVCIAKIEKVGADSYVNQLSLNAKTMKNKRTSKMLHDIDRIIFISGISIIPIGAVLFWQQFFINGNHFEPSVVSMVAAIIGMIPEGLYLLASVTLVIGCIILAKRKVLVQEMRCLEVLARTDVLCIDKTGTITEDKIVCNEAIQATCYPNDLPEFEELIGMIAAALPKDNPTISCIAEKYVKTANKVDVLEIIPFNSKNKFSSVTINCGTFKLGAAEFLLKDSLACYIKEIEKFSSMGYRVLVLTRDDKEYLGMLLMSNEIREGADKIFEYFNNNDVEIKVISGDSPLTVSCIAKQAAIKNSDKYIDMSKLEEETDMKEIADKYSVFGRTSPYQKKELILGLQKMGKTVAMVGDGVNDILALKTADCSVAMFSGSKAACHASTMVLLNSDFNDMPYIVKEGRRVVNNIERSAALFLYKNIFSFLLAILSILSISAYPLLPVQVSVIGVFTIGIPGLLFSQEANYNIIKENFIVNVMKKAIIPALVAFISIGSLSLNSDRLSLSEFELSVISAFIYAFIGFYNIYRVSRPYNRYRLFVIFTCILGFGMSILFFGNWIEIVLIFGKPVFVTLIYFILSYILFIFIEFLISKLFFSRRKKIAGF